MKRNQKRRVSKRKSASWQQDSATDEEFCRGYDQAHPRPMEVCKPAIEDPTQRCAVAEEKYRDTLNILAIVTRERNEAWRDLRLAKQQIGLLSTELDQFRLFKAIMKQLNLNPA